MIFIFMAFLNDKNYQIKESANWNGLEWVNLTQMTITSTIAGRNPSEEMK